MLQQVKYKSYYEIDNEKPHIELGFRFKDYFETNDYYIVSESRNYKSNESLTFQILKDDKKIGELELENLNFDSFLENFINLTNDHDFKKIVISEHLSNIKKDLVSFFDRFQKTILENKFTLEGEMLRMRKVAGII